MNKNFISILCKNESDYTKELNNFFSINNIDSILIMDNNDPSHEDLKNKGYYGMTKICDRPCSWEKSFYFIFANNLHHKYKYFYFIEEDVYSKDLNTFIKLINLWDNLNHDFIARSIKNKFSEPDWFWWEKVEKCDCIEFEECIKSFNPICRLSDKLLSKIDNYKNYFGKLIFHEILFPSLVNKFNMSCLDYDKNEYGKYIHTMIANPAISKDMILTDQIYHPCKDILK